MVLLVGKSVESKDEIEIWYATYIQEISDDCDMLSICLVGFWKKPRVRMGDEAVIDFDICDRKLWLKSCVLSSINYNNLFLNIPYFYNAHHILYITELICSFGNILNSLHFTAAMHS